MHTTTRTRPRSWMAVLAFLLFAPLCITIAAPDAAAQPASGDKGPIQQVVQLGDSYSAGFGMLPPVRQIDMGGHCGNESGEWRHHGRTQGAQLARAAGLPLESGYINLACGGGEAIPSGIKTQYEQLLADARFAHYAAQAGQPDAGDGLVIVLTMSGNDNLVVLPDGRAVPWVELFADCIEAGVRCGEMELSLLTAQLAEIRQSLLEQISQIAGDFPNATVRVMGYPALLGPNNSRWSDCNALGTSRELDGDEIALFDEIAAGYDSHLSETVARIRSTNPNVGFVPVADRFDGHGACSNDPWIVGIDLEVGDDTDSPLVPAANSFHPSAEGYDAYSQALIESLQGCFPDSLTPEGDNDPFDPSRPENWGNGLENDPTWEPWGGSLMLWEIQWPWDGPLTEPTEPRAGITKIEVEPDLLSGPGASTEPTSYTVTVQGESTHPNDPDSPIAVTVNGIVVPAEDVIWEGSEWTVVVTLPPTIDPDDVLVVVSQGGHTFTPPAGCGSNLRSDGAVLKSGTGCGPPECNNAEGFGAIIGADAEVINLASLLGSSWNEQEMAGQWSDQLNACKDLTVSCALVGAATDQQPGWEYEEGAGTTPRGESALFPDDLWEPDTPEEEKLAFILRVYRLHQEEINTAYQQMLTDHAASLQPIIDRFIGNGLTTAEARSAALFELPPPLPPQNSLRGLLEDCLWELAEEASDLFDVSDGRAACAGLITAIVAVVFDDAPADHWCMQPCAADADAEGGRSEQGEATADSDDDCQERPDEEDEPDDDPSWWEEAWEWLNTLDIPDDIREDLEEWIKETLENWVSKIFDGKEINWSKVLPYARLAWDYVSSFINGGSYEVDVVDGVPCSVWAGGIFDRAPDEQPALPVCCNGDSIDTSDLGVVEGIIDVGVNVAVVALLNSVGLGPLAAAIGHIDVASVLAGDQWRCDPERGCWTGVYGPATWRIDTPDDRFPRCVEIGLYRCDEPATDITGPERQYQACSPAECPGTYVFVPGPGGSDIPGYCRPTAERCDEGTALTRSGGEWVCGPVCGPEDDLPSWNEEIQDGCVRVDGTPVVDPSDDTPTIILDPTDRPDPIDPEDETGDPQDPTAGSSCPDLGYTGAHREWEACEASECPNRYVFTPSELPGEPALCVPDFPCETETWEWILAEGDWECRAPCELGSVRAGNGECVFEFVVPDDDSTFIPLEVEKTELDTSYMLPDGTINWSAFGDTAPNEVTGTSPTPAAGNDGAGGPTNHRQGQSPASVARSAGPVNDHFDPPVFAMWPQDVAQTVGLATWLEVQSGFEAQTWTESETIWVEVPVQFEPPECADDDPSCCMTDDDEFVCCDNWDPTDEEWSECCPIDEEWDPDEGEDRDLDGQPDGACVPRDDTEWESQTVTTTFQATPTQSIFSFAADGPGTDDVVCDNAGQPFAAGGIDPPLCGKDWKHSSAVLGIVEMTVQVVYDVSWTRSNGESGSGPMLSLPSPPLSLEVNEVLTYGAAGD